MTLPDSAYLQFTPDLRICRLLNGMWQVSGAHGQIEPVAALKSMIDHHDAGYTTWDLADHYGPAEDFIGAFRQTLRQRDGETALNAVQAFTKWVPRPMRMTRKIVQDAIDISRRRMGVDTLDLLQFHWWEYTDKGYLEALDHLAALRTDGVIKHLALTNFDTVRVREITERGIKIVSNQVQFSLVDRRPLSALIPYCRQHGITLLTYGTFGGGLISDAYLNQPEPRTLTTASARKYKQMIDQWGGWTLFQDLLRALRQIADKHSVSIANVATRWTLDQPAVAGVIGGVRLGVREHRADNARLFAFTLDDADHAQIDAVTARGRDLMTLIGDCGAEYRR
ncbi:MAG: aldo/keto reductase [Chloroflexota bacterium]|nr:aldo/keto reductase [Chloroflexota bacterium]